MRFSSIVVISLSAALHHRVAAVSVPTWPSSSDELEDIMFLNTGYRARGFAVAVTPCSFSAQGDGRIQAAEWIRTAFHDMATGNVKTGVGGLDASLVHELGGDNIGPAFQTTFETFAPFLSTRSSMADIIALGVYTAAGPSGVPLPQNSLSTLKQQFLRTGFNTTEMIAVTACGHTVGGVHAEDFPAIVPSGTGGSSDPHFDSTVRFDSRIAVEWVDGNTSDPLAVGPSVTVGQDSDRKVFGADGNVTMKAMANPATFASTCVAMLQKLIEVVPSGTTLTDPIVPYEVKPTALQLTLGNGGSQLIFEGEIRVRTTKRSASKIIAVELVYKDRNGGSNCGNCTITATGKGNAAGFDDTFTFYGFSTPIQAPTSISDFQVRISLADGSTETYDNNGSGFGVQDQIMLQTPQSCVDSEGNLTVVAAVRSGASTTPSLLLTLQTSTDGIPVPALQKRTVSMSRSSILGLYDLFSAKYTLGADQIKTTKFDVRLGDGSTSTADAFKSTGNLSAKCIPFSSTTVL